MVDDYDFILRVYTCIESGCGDVVFVMSAANSVCLVIALAYRMQCRFRAGKICSFFASYRPSIDPTKLTYFTPSPVRPSSQKLACYVTACVPRRPAVRLTLVARQTLKGNARQRAPSDGSCAGAADVHQLFVAVTTSIKPHQLNTAD